jgi:hypothetical protein
MFILDKRFMGDFAMKSSEIIATVRVGVLHTLGRLLLLQKIK